MTPLTSTDYSFMDYTRWSLKRRKMLTETHTRLIAKRKYGFPTFENDEHSPFSKLSAKEQNDMCFGLLKDGCIDIFTHAFYPIYDMDKNKLKFKVARYLDQTVKENLTKLTSLIRPIVQIRIKLSDLYGNLTCGLVARSVYDTINNFLNMKFPEIIESVFALANGSLSQLEKFSSDLLTDLLHLEKALSKMYKLDLIGGELISLLDRQEYREFKSSFIPVLFRDCIDAGMEHYNRFLHEFIYHGHTNADRFYEFPIWDLSKTNDFTASEFKIIDEKYDLPFDRRFVVLSELIPSIWKVSNVRDMIQNAMHTRRLISVLNSENSKRFELKEIIWSDKISVNEIYQHVKDANAIANESLLDKINETFDIQKFYSLLESVLFNPSLMWINNFVIEASQYVKEDPDPELFIGGLNEYFGIVFEKELEGLNKSNNLIKLKLYSYELFDKVLPSDQRLVDFLNVEIEIPNDDTTLGTDENIPVGQFSNSKISEKESAYDTTSKTSSEYSLESVSLVDQIGLEFDDSILMKCLIPPQVQEHLNRLFRLRLKLAKLDYLLTEKTINKSSPMSKMEQLFLFQAHGFIRKYLNTVFGYVANEQWNDFIKTTQKLKGVDSITKAQTYLIRNIFSPSGLYSGSAGFVEIFDQTLHLLDGYGREDEGYSYEKVASDFYKKYKEMRTIVYNNEHLKTMSYPVFRILPFAKLNMIDTVEIDPRNGALAPSSNLKPIHKSLSHRRSINLMPRRA